MERRFLLILMVFFSFSLSAATIFVKGDDDPLSVYPNPALDRVTLEMKIDNDRPPQIQILDLTGKVVLKYDDKLVKQQNQFKVSLDISELQSGIYFLKVVQGDSTYSEKLVVK